MLKNRRSNRRNATLAVALAALLVATSLLTTNKHAGAAVRNFVGFQVTADGQGYMMVSDAGEFYAFGNARPLTQPQQVQPDGSPAWP